jgi:hypothetical protein
MNVTGADAVAQAAHFSQSYAEARQKFLSACGQAGLPVISHEHPLSGIEGEALAMDVARLGPQDATRLLVVSSACHGVEGYCGSGVQCALLADSTWHAEAAAQSVAVLYVHGLNPYGFSWMRRATHENVDLNRNFQNFSQPLPRNAGYDELAEALLPATWPPSAEAEAVLQAYAQRHGMMGLQAAISGGQYQHPDGMFFGGSAPTWSQSTFRAVLREHGQQAARLAWIDVHTGLGPSGHGEKIHAGPATPDGLARAKAWWGPEVTSSDDGTSTSAPLTGLLSVAFAQECAQAQMAGIALEYGTLPVMQVMWALRAEHWLTRNLSDPWKTPRAVQQAIRQQMRDTFYVNTDEWKAAVVQQARQAAVQAVLGLAGGA